MKQCRFCDNMIPFYGSDTCYVCLGEVKGLTHYPSPDEINTMLAEFKKTRPYN